MRTVTTPRPGRPWPAPPRLIATDLDGTLLREDKTVSPRTVSALAAAEAAGIDVFFVTGRPLRWMEPVKDYVHGHGLAICNNGAAVVDMASGPGENRFVKLRPLARAAALEVVELLRALAPGTSFAVERTGHGLQHEPTYPRLYVEAEDLVAPAEKLLAEGGAGGTEPILKVLARHPSMDPDAFLTRGREAVGDRAVLTRSSAGALLEISGPGVSKASTLEECCAERGISPSEVVAFGDMPNDIEMLSWSGAGYAMGNAHPTVLAAAGHRTLTNEEDGVAAVIERILAAR
ncbi:HAD family hydrolase [Streptomyces sp. SCSIO ZS0520]|uniref:HAD family hydrolase n=1 Tax=Streptomyces sp. SCSIO ZS0520 TaxID=2892996 RepID=UPI0021DB098E|nr:Cof-type HAD-IIB family hydrolase [Streptomyces sp. SCSIO ZS0520]